MGLQVSTALKTALLAPFPGVFDGGHIRVFSGTKPSTADDAETGTYLGSITNGGMPVSFGTDLAGLQFIQWGPYIGGSMDQLFGMVVEGIGVASWFRLVGPSPDDGGPSFGLPRVDGECSLYTGYGPLFLPSLSLTPGQFISPIGFTYTIPPIVGL